LADLKLSLPSHPLFRHNSESGRDAADLHMNSCDKEDPVDTSRNAESAPYDPALLTRAHAATTEFNIALRALLGQGTPDERQRLHTAALTLTGIVAQVLLQTE
jgi:hypothetical protein